MADINSSERLRHYLDHENCTLSECMLIGEVLSARRERDEFEAELNEPCSAEATDAVRFLLRMLDRARCGCLVLDCPKHGSYAGADVIRVNKMLDAERAAERLPPKTK